MHDAILTLAQAAPSIDWTQLGAGTVVGVVCVKVVGELFRFLRGRNGGNEPNGARSVEWWQREMRVAAAEALATGILPILQRNEKQLEKLSELLAQILACQRDIATTMKYRLDGTTRAGRAEA